MPRKRFDSRSRSNCKCVPTTRVLDSQDHLNGSLWRPSTHNCLRNSKVFDKGYLISAASELFGHLLLFNTQYAGCFCISNYNQSQGDSVWKYEGGEGEQKAQVLFHLVALVSP